jgi:hypothetical protein
MSKHPHKGMLYNARRRAKALNRYGTVTLQDYEDAIAYFGFRCPVCGVSLIYRTGENPCSVDHWIAIDSGGDGTRYNIVPMCHFCNTSKSNHDPYLWLAQRYGWRKAKEIVARVEAYFAWVRGER